MISILKSGSLPLFSYDNKASEYVTICMIWFNYRRKISWITRLCQNLEDWRRNPFQQMNLRTTIWFILLSIFFKIIQNLKMVSLMIFNLVYSIYYLHFPIAGRPKSCHFHLGNSKLAGDHGSMAPWGYQYKLLLRNSCFAFCLVLDNDALKCWVNIYN
jgi:hypothetical protein